MRMRTFLSHLQLRYRHGHGRGQRETATARAHPDGHDEPRPSLSAVPQTTHTTLLPARGDGEWIQAGGVAVRFPGLSFSVSRSPFHNLIS